VTSPFSHRSIVLCSYSISSNSPQNRAPTFHLRVAPTFERPVFWTELQQEPPRTGPLLLNCFYFLMHYMHIYLRTSHYIIIYLNYNSKAPYLKIWLKIRIFKFKFKHKFGPNLTTLITNQKTHSNSSWHHYQMKRHMVESPSLVLVINDTMLLMPWVKCFELVKGRDGGLEGGE
jgi:hypothetical protein